MRIRNAKAVKENILIKKSRKSPTKKIVSINKLDKDFPLDDKMQSPKRMQPNTFLIELCIFNIIYALKDLYIMFDTLNERFHVHSS